MIDIQAMYLILRNWNQSYASSSFVWPSIEPFDKLPQKPVTTTVETKTIVNPGKNVIITSTENQLERSSNIGLTTLFGNARSIENSTYQVVDKAVDMHFEETDFVDLISLIYSVMYTVSVLQLQYDFIRNDGGKFSLLMNLRSRTRPIIDGIPKFSTLPYICPQDFYSWRIKYPYIVTLPSGLSDKEVTMFNITNLYHVEQMQPKTMVFTDYWYQYFIRYDSEGSGFYWKTGQTKTKNGKQVAVVQGYWGGYFPAGLSNGFFTFTGTIPIDLSEEDFDNTSTNKIQYYIDVDDSNGIVSHINMFTSKWKHEPGVYDL